MLVGHFVICSYVKVDLFVFLQLMCQLIWGGVCFVRKLKLARGHPVSLPAATTELFGHLLSHPKWRTRLQT